MKKKRNFVVMMKTFVVEFIFQFKIHENIEIVFENHVFTKFIDANLVDFLNVDVNHRKNDSFIEILIVKKTKIQIKINDINEFLQKIRFK